MMAPIVGLIRLPSLLQMYLSGRELHPHRLVHRIGVPELLEIGAQRSSKTHFEVFKAGALGVQNPSVNDGLLESRVVEFAAGKFRSGELRIHEPAASKIAGIEFAVPKVTGIKKCISEIYLCKCSPHCD